MILLVNANKLRWDFLLSWLIRTACQVALIVAQISNDISNYVNAIHADIYFQFVLNVIAKTRFTVWFSGWLVGCWCFVLFCVVLFCFALLCFAFVFVFVFVFFFVCFFRSLRRSVGWSVGWLDRNGFDFFNSVWFGLVRFGLAWFESG